MPDHMPPSFAPDSPPDPDADRITDVRLIRSRAFEAGRVAGYEEGQRAAQTEVDGLTYERGVTDERARVEGLIAHHFADAPTDADEILRAIRSGEPAPKPGT